MKKRILPFMLLAAALGITGCSDKDLDVTGADNNAEVGKFAYINAAISLPSSSFTRSKTDDPVDTDDNNNTNSNGDGQIDENDKTAKNPDYEYGYDYENEVRSMILVIANTNDEYLTHTVVPTITPTKFANNDNPGYVVDSKIPYKVLEEAYGDNGILGKTIKENDNKVVVNLYAYCNYTSDIQEAFEKYALELEKDKTADRKAWINLKGTVVEAPAAAGKPKPTITNSIWAKRSFLMSNYEQYKTDKFPTDIDGWDSFSDKNNPLDLTKGESTNKQPLKVERAAARIDFKDGSKEGDNTYPVITKERIITTVSGADGTSTKQEEVKGKNYFSVKLTRMALVNMSKEFYYLRRVSDNGMEKADEKNSNNWAVSGLETPRNYVVDVDAEDKSQEKGIKPTTAENHFNFCLYEKDDNTVKYNIDGWYADNIDDVLSDEKNPNTDQWNNTSTYHIWRYVTENTIPQSEDPEDLESQQKTIQSTGIVFKGSIIPGDNLEDEDAKVSEAVKAALLEAAKEEKDGVTRDPEKLPILYSFNNILYAGMVELIEEAYNDGENGPLYQAVNNILIKHWEYNSTDHSYTFSEKEVTVEDGTEQTDEDRAQKHADDLTVTRCHDILNNTDGYWSDYSVDFTNAEKKESVKEIEKAFCTLVPAENITVYEATEEGDAESDGAGWGYYCYYFYWNRHNDNLKSGKMGPMEFATVRNNIYKLSVSGISQLGHPRDAAHDPDPVDPEDPDEDPMNYIKVDVEILPWVVRINDIKF